MQCGFMNGMTNALRELISEHVSADNPSVMDLGCGEGTFGRALFEDCSKTYCGIDLSKQAIKLATRSWKDATWVVANADRILPAADSSVDLLISLFGRRPTTEINRVLRVGGCFVAAIPGPNDLLELREIVQKEAQQRDRHQAVIDQCKAAGLDLAQHRLWTFTATMDSDAVKNALAMTYRAFRNSEHDRIETISEIDVTLQAHLLVFKAT